MNNVLATTTRKRNTYSIAIAERNSNNDPVYKP